MLPAHSVGAPPSHDTTQGSLVPPVHANQRKDLAGLEHILYQEVADANAQAQAKGSVPRRYPVARVKHIMKRSVPSHRPITMSHAAVLAMPNLTKVMTACIAKVTWERTKERCASSSSTPCVQLMDAVSATSSMPQFDFLIDVNAAAMEEKRRAEQAQEARRLRQQIQAMQEQQTVLMQQLVLPDTAVNNNVAMPPAPHNFSAAFAPNLPML